MTERTSAPNAKPATLPPTPEDAAIAAKREQFYAARRASIHSLNPPPSGAGRSSRPSNPIVAADDEPASAAAPAKAPRKVSTPILVAGLGVALGLVLFGAAQLVGSIRRSSPEGKMKHALLAVDLATPELAAREAGFAAIDAGVDGPSLALALLDDVSHAEEGSSRSSHTYRELAAEYLLARAAVAKAPPPPEAQKTATLLRTGQHPSEDEWKELHAAWATWLSSHPAR